MANTKQAKKRAEQSTRLRAANRAVKSAVRGTIKKVRQAADTDPKAAAAQLPGASSALDVAVRKGTLHRKTASRLKSRLAKQVNKVNKANAAK